MFDIAQIVDVHPESNSVDVLLMRNGQRIANVQVLQPAAGSTFGHINMAIPDLTDPDKYETEKTDTQDIYGVVCLADFRPVLLGFLYPQRSQMLFEEKERRIDRHASDVYSTVDKDGNIELHHPSGTYIRFGVDSEHEDLTAKDYDKLWDIKKNTDKAVDVRLHVRNQNGFQSEILMTKDGQINVKTQGDITVEGGANIAVTAVGDITLDAAQLTINAPVAISGAALTHNGVNVGSTHTHLGVMSGPSITGTPVP